MSGCPWSYFKKWILSVSRLWRALGRTELEMVITPGASLSDLSSAWKPAVVTTPTPPLLPNFTHPPPSNPFPFRLLHPHPHKKSDRYRYSQVIRTHTNLFFPHRISRHHTLHSSLIFIQAHLHTCHKGRCGAYGLLSHSK